MSKCPLLLTVILIFIVINTKAQRSSFPIKSSWYKEYKYYFLWRQCRHWKSIKGLTLKQCQHECDKIFECTAINWEYKTPKCEIMMCGYFPPYPTGFVDNGWWKGYSKYQLEDPGEYYGPYANHWSNNQCPVIGRESGSDVNRVRCERICNINPHCSGFNFKSEGSRACVLRNCGRGPPPPPIGNSWDWESYSKKQTDPYPPTPKCPSFYCQGKKKYKGGCADFGHACWGGHGRRGKISVTGASASPGQAQQKALMEVLMAPLLASATAAAADHDNTNTEHTLVHHTDDTAKKNHYSTGEQEFKRKKSLQ